MAVIAEYKFGECRIRVHDDQFLSPEKQEEAKRKINAIAVMAVMEKNSRKGTAGKIEDTGKNG